MILPQRDQFAYHARVHASGVKLTLRALSLRPVANRAASDRSSGKTNFFVGYVPSLEECL